MPAPGPARAWPYPVLVAIPVPRRRVPAGVAEGTAANPRADRRAVRSSRPLLGTIALAAKPTVGTPRETMLTRAATSTHRGTIERDHRIRCATPGVRSRRGPGAATPRRRARGSPRDATRDDDARIEASAARCAAARRPRMLAGARRPVRAASTAASEKVGSFRRSQLSILPTTPSLRRAQSRGRARR